MPESTRQPDDMCGNLFNNFKSMIISKTRKAIIELIEPFMDKTLNEGCIIEWRWIYRKIVTNFHILWTHKDWEYTQIYPLSTQRSWDWIYWAEIEIIGHYDITSVLKFITSKLPWGYSWIRFSESWLIHFEWIWSIPNKPLHLFTEEKDKELLGILEQLK